MNSRRFVRFVGERQSWFLDATRRTTKKLQKCSSQSSSGTSGRGLRDCEGWSVKARKAKRFAFWWRDLWVLPLWESAWIRILLTLGMNRTPHLPDVRWGSQKHQIWNAPGLGWTVSKAEQYPRLPSLPRWLSRTSRLPSLCQFSRSSNATPGPCIGPVWLCLGLLVHLVLGVFNWTVALKNSATTRYYKPWGNNQVSASLLAGSLPSSHRMSQEDWAACRWVLWEFRCEFCKFPKVICSFLFRHWISLSAPPHAVQLLVAVVPYLGHNSAYVRGSQHSVVVGFCARIT